RPFDHVISLSGLPLQADLRDSSPRVSEMPKGKHMHRSKNTGYSITSSARASRVGGIFDAECHAGDQVDDEIELGRLLNWNIARLGTAQVFIDVVGSARVQVREIRTIRHQTCRFDVLALRVHCR